MDIGLGLDSGTKIKTGIRGDKLETFTMSKPVISGEWIEFTIWIQNENLMHFLFFY